MPNLKERIEALKNLRGNLKDRKFTRKDAAVGISAALVIATISGVSGYNPGMLLPHVASSDGGKYENKTEFSKLAGPKQILVVKDTSLQRTKMEKKAATSSKQTSPASLPMTMPGGFSAPSSFGGGTVGGAKEAPGAAKAKAAYARHTELTGKMGSMLSSTFSLTKTAPEPKGTEDRFSTTYEYAVDGSTLEKFELMTIVRNPRMESIKTAQDALESLIEESKSINVIESTDSYLLYDFAGDGGYQIGKISLDNDGIYIFGYINLTTSELPDALKADWKDKLKNSL